MQTCRHADMQTCRHADMQTCRHAGMQTCRHAGMQTCMYDHVSHVCIHACNMHVCIHACMTVWVNGQKCHKQTIKCRCCEGAGRKMRLIVHCRACFWQALSFSRASLSWGNGCTATHARKPTNTSTNTNTHTHTHTNANEGTRTHDTRTYEHTQA